MAALLMLPVLGVASESPGRMALKQVVIGGQEFIVEVAATAEQRSRGLMGRESLAINRGMLFDYPYQGNYRIWMKNTLIPLLVLWVGADSRVQAVKTLYPCGTGDCLSYGIKEKSRYVIELNAEVSGISKGMTVFGLD